MRAYLRPLAAVLIGQTVCIGVGLWMYGNHMAAAARLVLRDSAYAELELACRVWCDAVAPVDPERPAHDAEQRQADPSAPARRAARTRLPAPLAHTTLAQMRELLERRQPPVDVLLLDAHGRVVAGASGANPAEAAHPAKGVGQEVSIDWSARGEAPPSDELRRATLARSDGAALAVGWALQDGQVVFYRPCGALEAATTAIRRRILPIGAVTLLWVSALLAVMTYLVSSRLRDALRNQTDRFSHDALQQTQQLVRARDALIFALAKLADSRDPETGDHLERITIYTRLLAEAARRSPAFARQISPTFIHLISLAAALHDIGKVGIEDRILQKRGRLTPDERRRMQAHTLIAEECLADIARRVGESPLLQMARQIAVAHHEHWDGRGYPHGLRGAQIPLAARIVAIADVYDALSSHRVYKPALSHEACARYIREAAGRHFDPDLVAVWTAIEKQFAAISRGLGHRPEDERDAAADGYVVEQPAAEAGMAFDDQAMRRAAPAVVAPREPIEAGL